MTGTRVKEYIMQVMDALMHQRERELLEALNKSNVCSPYAIECDDKSKEYIERQWNRVELSTIIIKDKNGY
jgi:hypothetical protein